MWKKIDCDSTNSMWGDSKELKSFEKKRKKKRNVALEGLFLLLFCIICIICIILYTAKSTEFRLWLATNYINGL